MNIINIATGGADKNTWLDRIDFNVELDLDVILVKLPVKD